MSNYPPGVTGNEYPIAGPDREWDDYRECESEGFSILTITGYGKHRVAEAIEKVLQTQRAISTLPVHQRESVKDPYRVTPDTGFVRADEIDLAGLTVAVAYLRAALSDIESVDVDGKCPFGGDVTLQTYNGIESWECPVCRETHEKEID